MDLLSTHLEKCHSILMFESLMNRYLSAHWHTSHLLSLIAINRIEQIYFERIIISTHRHTSHLLSLIAINRIEQIYFERIIISTHRHISMKVMTSRSFRITYLSPYRHISQKVMTSRSFRITYLSPYRHISQFRIHEISCIHRSLLAKYFKLYYSYRHIGTDNSVIIPIVDME